GGRISIRCKEPICPERGAPAPRVDPAHVTRRAGALRANAGATLSSDWTPTKPLTILTASQTANPMRTLLIGIDSGTQSTKGLVVDAKNGRVIAASAETYDLIPGLAPGAKEQHPHTWRDAMQKAVRKALAVAAARPGEVKAIGVSGQQHGFVPLDQKGEV